jgi:hypothetical protein
MLLAIGALAAPSVAQADTASVSFTDAAGNSDPVAGVGRTFTVSGNSGTPKRLWIRYRAVGGAPCAPSASSDSGSDDFDGFSYSDQFNGTDVNGNFTLKKTGSWNSPGEVLFCMWLATSSSTAVTPISQTVSFRSPTGTISGTVDPTAPSQGQTTTLNITGASEAPKSVFATVKSDGGAGCAATYSADAGEGVMSNDAVNGSFSLSTTFTAGAPGAYVVCLWLAASSTDASPVAGPQPVSFTVPAPPPACVVPSVPYNIGLNAMRNALTAANCTPGSIKRVRSRTVRKGRVVRLSRKPGTVLRNGAVVNLTLSRGRY